MRPRALKANKTLTPLETPELLLLPLLEPLEVGELVGVEVWLELVGVEIGVVVKVTPYAELAKMQEIKDGMLTHHSLTHRNSSSDRFLEVIAGTAALETNSGLIDKVLVVAQTAGIVECA